MIQVIENAGQEIPAEIVACGPRDLAPAYLIVDPKQGSAFGRARVEEEIRANYKRGAMVSVETGRVVNIIFIGHHVLPDGRIVSVGQKVDPIIAQMRLKP